MDGTTIAILIVIVAVVAVIAMAAFWLQRRQSQDLKEGFGPEYERTLRETGSKSKAERELAQRRKRVEAMQIRPLSRDERMRFEKAWNDLQSGFVDEPERAVRNADRLITDVMRTRGYPTGDFARRANDVSVNYPQVVGDYRTAHTVVESYDKGKDVGTEELRQAVRRYRSLFERLMEDETAELRRPA
jgi:hypothetical protein